MSAATAGSHGPAMFELWVGPHTGRTLAVVSFRGREAISKPFSFDVRVLAPPDVAAEGAALLGQTATLILRSGADVARTIRGVVASIEPDGTSTHDGRRRLRLRVVPRLWLAKHRSGSRVFQDQTVVAIVSAVLGEHGVPMQWRLSREYPARAYCTQYRESDYQFVTRLLAEEGIFFFFEPPPSAGIEIEIEPGLAAPAETIVFGDAAEHIPAVTMGGGPPYPPAQPVQPFTMGGGPPYPPAQPVTMGHGDMLSLALREGRGLSDLTDEVHDFAFRSAVRTGATLLRDYDFRRPMLDLRAEADLPTNAGALRAYVYRGEFDEPEVSPARARIDLEQRRRKANVARGSSTCRRLAAGHRFRLAAEATPELDRGYAVTRVEHEGHTPELDGRAGSGDHRSAYECRFECVPDDTVFRPARPKRVVQQVLESATVVGPPGEEVHTDAYGRIKVRFHWDLTSGAGDRGSCWVRVIQAWAGAGWGCQFIPRVGMEAMVTFLGGDPDCPVVIGCVYNTTHPVPFPLPEHRTRSVIRTESSPGGGGFNELRFEDRKGDEQIFIHAERDFEQVVNRNLAVSAGGDERREIGGAHTVVVGAGATSLVAGDLRDSVGGSRRESTGGEHEISSQGGRADRVGGDLALTVGGAEKRAIGGSSNVTIAKDSRVQIGGRHEIRVGGEDEEGASLQISGDYRVGATGKVEIKADDGITLKCGGTTIELGPKLLRLLAESLVAAGSESASLFGKGPMVRLGEEITLAGDKMQIAAGDEIEITADTRIRLTTKDASIKLDAEAAKVDGKVVKLNCKPEAPPEQDEDEVEEQEEQPPKPMLRIVATDHAGKPYAKRPYKLIVDGATVGEGTIPDDGLVQHEVSESAQKAELQITLAEGRTLTMRMNVGKLPPVSETRGLKARLQSLGHYHGEVDDTLDDATKLAIRAFQRDAGLDVTGEADEVTRAKLMKMTHG